MAETPLAEEYLRAIDELFTAESKKDLITNDAFVTSHHLCYVYSVNTVPLNDYDRDGENDEYSWSRYGDARNLAGVTQVFTIDQDKSFTFVIDAMEQRYTDMALAADTAMARQIREVVIPTYDKHIYSKICNEAGTTVTSELTKDNIYEAILDASQVLDDNYVPETERTILIPPKYYKLLKMSDYIMMQTDVGQDMRLKGVVGVVDGTAIVRVPENRLPENTGFVMVHKSACCAPFQLEEYIEHINPPGINGTLCEGRIVYDAYVLKNKKCGIYLHKTA